MLSDTRKPAVPSWLASLAFALGGVAGCTGSLAPPPAPPGPAPRPKPVKAPADVVEPAPGWVTDTPPATREKIFFTGWVEGYYADPYQGFEEAERRALAQVANSIAVHVSSKVVVYEDEHRQQVSSEIRTWASEYVRKLPGRR